MGTYITEVTINGKLMAWPNIEARSYAEADNIAASEYNDMYEVVWELEFVLDLDI